MHRSSMSTNYQLNRAQNYKRCTELSDESVSLMFPLGRVIRRSFHKCLPIISTKTRTRTWYLKILNLWSWFTISRYQDLRSATFRYQDLRSPTMRSQDKRSPTMSLVFWGFGPLNFQIDKNWWSSMQMIIFTCSSSLFSKIKKALYRS